MILFQQPQIIPQARQQGIETVIRRRQGQPPEAMVTAELGIRNVQESDRGCHSQAPGIGVIFRVQMWERLIFFEQFLPLLFSERTV
jgi:hypothetical protein